MAAVTLTLTLDQLKAALPAALSPIIDSAASVFGTWSSDTVRQWLALAQADSSAAQAILLAAMTDAQRTSQTQADEAALAAEVAANADRVAAQKQLLADAWHAILVVAASALTVAI